jgi:hypothetical protein
MNNEINFDQEVDMAELTEAELNITGGGRTCTTTQTLEGSATNGGEDRISGSISRTCTS